MASASRFAAVIGRSSLRIRPPKFDSNHKSVTAFSSSTSLSTRAVTRFAPVLGSLGTMLPLHSTIAGARLKSNIAVDTTCWSWLSQASRIVEVPFRSNDPGIWCIA
ncbi:uncharacterized protein LOC121746836 isoform X1 [Salvia splendens]|uniref:uncharacterized protein LOC121746836 isoform X1 n=1 Tax=Salvia splendens TaxID=180675 RepID=UPI001C27ED84|nr:uncharacterized protein LOC121746836 isoform X1 [Salvia splendens]